MLKPPIKKRFLVITVLLFLVISLVLYLKALQKTTAYKQTVRINTNKDEFISNSLKIQFLVPTGFRVAEKDNLLVFYSQDKPVINIGRNTTNFSNLLEYVNYLAKMNNWSIIKYQPLLQNSNFQTAKVISNAGQDIFLYKNGWIYVFSRESSDFDDELDEIVSSLRFIGD